MPAGSDSISRSLRENYASEILPNLLINRGDVGFAGGDWNCIVKHEEANNLPDSKMSPSLCRLIKCFNLKDSHKVIHTKSVEFSHFYRKDNEIFGTRIDRQYHWGETNINKSEYILCAFSDHLGLICEVTVPFECSVIRGPRGQPHFKLKDTNQRCYF